MQSTSNDLPIYSVPLLLLFFAGMWCLTCVIISVVSGWQTLSRRFRATSEPSGQIQSAGPFLYSVYMRFRTHDGNVVSITTARNGLFLSVLFLFRIGHPTLCIPWHEISSTKTSFLWWNYIVLRLGTDEQIPLRISERFARDAGILDHLRVSV